MAIVFITGGAGFIGAALSKRLLDDGMTVIGLDNLNDYYDVKIKNARLEKLGEYKNYTFIKGDMADKECVEKIFSEYNPEYVQQIAGYPRFFADLILEGFPEFFFAGGVYEIG